MYVLGIDAAATASGAALITSSKVVSEFYVNIGLTHSQTLLPIISQVLEEAGVTPPELGGIAVTCGPGSFTGIRIGLATAKGMAQVLGCPLIGIPTLDAWAHNLRGTAKLICPILDARKKQVYTALYDGAGNRLTEYSVISLEQLISQLPGQQITFLGDGVPVYRALLEEALGSRAEFAGQAHNCLRASAVAEMGLERIAKGEDDGWSDLNPLYVRASEAETTLARKLALAKAEALATEEALSEKGCD